MRRSLNHLLKLLLYNSRNKPIWLLLLGLLNLRSLYRSLPKLQLLPFLTLSSFFKLFLSLSFCSLYSLHLLRNPTLLSSSCCSLLLLLLFLFYFSSCLNLSFFNILSSSPFILIFSLLKLSSSLYFRRTKELRPRIFLI